LALKAIKNIMTPEIFVGLNSQIKKTFLSRQPENEKQYMMNICRVVYGYLGIDMDYMTNPKRTEELVKPKHISMFLMKKFNPKLYQTVIGRLFNVNHASVIYAIGAVEDQIKTNKYYRKQVENIIELLNQ
jgi:chromosomal replication initiation ATPase DnaA